MMMWGGADSSGDVNSGGRYTPSTDSWTATSMTNAAAGRDLHATVWTGIEMIVWGGRTSGSSFNNTGGRYNPTTDNWVATTTTNAPEPRDITTGVWKGGEMIGCGGDGAFRDVNTRVRANATS